MTLSSSLAMGGYAFYVWSAYGIGLAVFVGCILSSVRDRRKIFHQLNKNLNKKPS